MAISIQQFTSNTELLAGLSAALTSAGIFDAATVSGTSVSCVKDGNALFSLQITTTSSTIRYDYWWKNKYGTTIFTGYLTSASGLTAAATIATCGNSVMLINNLATFVFGKTTQGTVYMGFTYQHKNALTDGQSISMSETTATMYAKAFLTDTHPLWSRFAPICVQSQENVVETTDGVYGFIERYTAIPTTGASIVPTQFTQDGKNYLTDGSFVLEDK